jgi:cysteinyl-tRNA synthetase
MSIKLFNTLTKQKEEFKPIDPNNVRIYVCGPTVYDRAHIGNARAVVVFDTLYRLLINNYGNDKVTYVRNITDVDDKINKAASEKNIDISTLTDKTIKAFHNDMSALNCLTPDIEPRATEHIEGMIKMCEQLIEYNHAYVAERHVLFSVKSYNKYGNLSRRSKEDMIAGARVEIAPYKEDPADFVLWKPSEAKEPGWDSPWGRGRPGWHIECSVMSTKYLGHSFDIHGGGIDLQFPHHENEIAQSCCAYPKSDFAKYWVHNGFLSVEGEKMSKSLGNFITVRDLLDQNITGEVIRHAILSTHYRKPLDWTKKALTDAQKAMDKFYRVINNNPNNNYTESTTLVSKTLITDDLDSEFISALEDDLNTPKAYSILHKLADENKASSLKACANLIGLLQNDPNKFLDHDSSIEEYVNQLIIKRNKAREEKNWQESDRIRDELKTQGIALKDNSDGTTAWSKLYIKS